MDRVQAGPKSSDCGLEASTYGMLKNRAKSGNVFTG